MATVVMEIATVDVMTAVVAFFSFLTFWLAKVEQLDDDD
jgi:hypothetical protein